MPASPLFRLIPVDVVEHCLLPHCSATDLLALSSCCTWLRESVDSASVWEHALAKRHKFMIDEIFDGIAPQPPALCCARGIEIRSHVPQSAASTWKRFLFKFHEELMSHPSPAIDSAIDSGLFRAAANLDDSNVSSTRVLVHPRKTQLQRRPPLMMPLASKLALVQWAGHAVVAVVAQCILGMLNLKPATCRPVWHLLLSM